MSITALYGQYVHSITSPQALTRKEVEILDLERSDRFFEHFLRFLRIPLFP